MGSDISADWWTLFHSKPLNELIEQCPREQSRPQGGAGGVVGGQGKCPGATGRLLSERRGRLFGQPADGNRGKSRPTLNSNAFLYDLFTPQVSVSYVPDVFGLNRRTVESLQAQEQEVRFQMIATYTTLTANVVVTAIQQASLQMQIEATRELIDINSHMVEILKYQFDKGYASRLDLAAQESQLAQVAATLPPLLKQSAQLQDLLAVLAGRFPSQAPEEKFELSSLQLPQDLPVSLPSELVAQRPGCAPGRGKPARCQREDRHRDRESPAEFRADRQCRQLGGGHESAVHHRHRLLGVGRGRDGTRSSRAGHCCTRSAPRRRPTCRPPNNIAARF